MKIYLSGAISGRPIGEVRESFNSMAQNLEMLGYEVVNPLNNGLPENSTWSEHMRADIKDMIDCDIVLMLKGWQGSKGAALEHYIANALNFYILYEGNSIDERLLERPKDLSTIVDIFKKDTKNEKYTKRMRRIWEKQKG